ncbi:MAG: adenylate kinase [Candidatus Nomurabacteria bacterium GW2011_GWB1_40_7]|uniref:Adenylate kinase n=1 Tax=Candidatus Nomurabacteria bacterium GW2011_GWB1_40_7 TaxID=1618744 RepID=A0A0G0T148_9BACT|nr:MAG: adenylate kinase [Candidatus Nomurabacteria bacterium GW2011_GWB1_40_7]
MNSRAFVFFGKSGCGKGTQAELLADYLNKKGEKVLHIETGKAFRRLAEGDGLSGKNIQNILKNGDLIPVFLPIWVWTDFMIKNFTGEEFVILDGVCRRREEAVALGSAFDFYKIKNPSIILMNVSKKWSSDKMLGRRRTDDTPEKIENRLNWYEKDVMPSIDYFREGPGYNFVEINGEQTIEKVHEDIIKALGY